MQKETLCLGLLSLGPRSGYEIKQMFEEDPTLETIMEHEYTASEFKSGNELLT